MALRRRATVGHLAPGYGVLLDKPCGVCGLPGAAGVRLLADFGQRAELVSVHRAVCHLSRSDWAERRVTTGRGCRERNARRKRCAGEWRAVCAPLSADGLHRARVFATDAAGNRGVSSPFEFATRNGLRPNGLNATRFATLSTWFDGGSRRRVSATVRYGATRTIRGQLKTADGAPIPNAIIDVSATHLRVGARQRASGQLTTDAEGRFAYRPPAGPSRTFAFGYRAFSLDEGYSATGTTRLLVRPKIALRVTPRRVRNGQRVTFSGRLVGGPGRADATVVLYALTGESRKRIPVESARTDDRGRFRLRYRFRTVTGQARFRFNARIQRQAGYPYASGASPAVAVRVRG
jgi:hypothetical protein